LRAGSGLKIKLVEALGHGKAIVTTTTTLQGVEDLVGPAVIVTDDAASFAAEVVSLLKDPGARGRLCATALEVARTYFSAAACYAPVVDYFARAREPHARSIASSAIPPPK